MKGTVTATASKSNGDSDGIDVYGDFAISKDAEVTAIGSEARDYSEGIYVSSGKLTINGGKVTATAGKAGDDSFGICADENFIINGGKVTAAGGEADTRSYGILVVDTFTFKGRSLTAQGKTAAMNKQPEVNTADYGILASEKEDGSGAVDFSETDFANYRYISIRTPYSIKITRGKAAVSGTEVSKAIPGTVIDITADEAETGKAFDVWTSFEVDVKEPAKKETTFIMPEKDVTITANYIDADHEHSFILVPEKKATCTESGLKEYYVCDCGRAFEDEARTKVIPDLEVWKKEGGKGFIKAEHKFTEGYVKENSDKEKHYHVCTVCGEKDEGAAHVWNAEAATEEKAKLCTVCGYVAEAAGNHEHKGTKVEGKAATCLEAGIKDYYTCECGKFFEDEACEKAVENIVTWKVIPALGHDFFDDFTEEVHWRECSRCGEVTPKEAHVYDGSKDKDCNVCGFVKGLSITIIHAESVDAGGNAGYTYSGSPIKPQVIVKNYAKILTEGVDYTVSYKNNTKASEGAAENKKPAIIVKGKGNYAGTTTKTFEITRCPLSEVKAGAVTVVKGSKAVPVLIHNGIMLGKKDYTNPDAATKFTEDKEITLTGEGNYTGTLKVSVKVVSSKADLKKFKVALGSEKPVYDGTAKKISYTVTDASTKATLTEGTDYTVTYQKDTISAGKVKVSFTGINSYTGNVAKAYTIKPNTTAGMNVTGINAGGYAYQAGGVKPEGLKVTCTLNGTAKTLEEGKDYSIAYSNFAKTGSAKYSVKFLGNYKGTKALTGNYTVNAAVLDNTTEGLKITLPDMVYGTKPGTYASKPVVSVGGVLLKPAEYTVNYYKDEALTSEITKNSTVTVDSTPVTVYVKVTGKGNYGKDTSKYATASYQVVPAAGATDLKNVKITFRNADGTVTNKFEYTGKEVEPEVLIGGTPADLTKVDVTYHNNIQKGKATVVIRAKAGSGYAGGKTANFNITTRNVGSIIDLWRKLISK